MRSLASLAFDNHLDLYARELPKPSLPPTISPLVLQLKKYFTFEVQVLDDKNVRRRFRASNYQAQLSFVLPP